MQTVKFKAPHCMCVCCEEWLIQVGLASVSAKLVVLEPLGSWDNRSILNSTFVVPTVSSRDLS